MSKWMYVVGIVLMAGFAVLMVFKMQSASTQYVMKVDDALLITNRPIQFNGAIVHNKTAYTLATHELRFTLRDSEGKTLEVHYKGPKPASLDSADSAVARGYIKGGKMEADQVLLKCPSKYKGDK